ncbi:uncharacterized protein LOC123309598 [Coccinella septempunctata]|uniref:uncharacterized protein LOC123309598 n=1 Tax=Coccinella septempunctata TaxID=41139 RepID=UPI001D06CC86|nr:uncharacterized protein LOC123309598 [Coccinella septempunctata]
MCSKFSTVEDNHLLKLLKDHPEIYDKDLKIYRDKSVKAVVWSEIARTLGRSVADCKGRWKNVRDYYKKRRSEVIKDEGFTSASFDSFKQRFKNLSFLEEIILRETQRDSGIYGIENVEQEDLLLEEDPLCLIKVENDTEFLETSNSVNSEPNQNTNEDQVISHEQNKDVQNIRKKRRRNNESLNDGSPTVSPDPATSMFFESIAMTVSKFSPHLRAEAKIAVLKIVSKLEMQNLEEEVEDSGLKFDKREMQVNSPITDMSVSTCFSPNSGPNEDFEDSVFE